MARPCGAASTTSTTARRPRASTAFASGFRHRPGAYEIEAKSNEIPAAQTMIRELGLTGVIVHRRRATLSKKPLKRRGTPATFCRPDQSQPADPARYGESAVRQEPPADTAQPSTAPPRPPGASPGRDLRCRRTASARSGKNLIITAIRVTRLTWHKDTKSGYLARDGGSVAVRLPGAAPRRPSRGRHPSPLGHREGAGMAPLKIDGGRD